MENSGKNFKLLNTEKYSLFLKLCDAQLQSEDGYTFDVHRYHLANSSSYFVAMFCGVQSENRREFTIPGISGECLGEILSYIYSKEVSVTEHNVVDLLLAADYLLLTELYQHVKERFTMCLTAGNSLKLFAAADMINDKCVSMLSFRFIQIRFEEIMHCRENGLADIPIDVLCKILSNSCICVRSELTVWKVIVDWIHENVTERLKYTPQLLSLLARKEINEELVTAILQHTIVNGNTFISEFNDMKNSLAFSCNHEILQKYLDNCVRMDYRIPPELHVVVLRTKETESSSLYLTYDNNMDFCRKIGEANFYPDFVIPIGHNIFVFGEEESFKFDLSSEQYFPLRNFRNSLRDFSVVNVDDKLYILGEVIINNNRMYDLEVYQPDTDLWISGRCPTNVSYAIAVAISKKIYVVGYTSHLQEIVAQVFDVETWQWCPLPPPDIFRTEFWMVAFREYLYLVGGSDDLNGETTKVEIFDTNANIWIEVADIPYVYEDINAVVWKDQVVVFDRAPGWYESESIMCWNEKKNVWEAFDKSSRVDLQTQLFSTIVDIDSVRIITQRNRNVCSECYRRIFV